MTTTVTFTIHWWWVIAGSAVIGGFCLGLLVSAIASGIGVMKGLNW